MKTIKTILFSLDACFDTFGLTITCLFLFAGITFPVPVLVLAVIADVSAILEGSALIGYLIIKEKAVRLAEQYSDNEEYEDEEYED